MSPYETSSNPTVLFQIRPAHPTDAQGFNEIFKDLNWFEPEGQIITADSEFAYQVTNRFYEQMREAQDSSFRSFFVAETYKSELVGYASVYWMHTSHSDRMTGLLSDLYVLKTHSDQPISQALLDTVIAEAHNKGADQLLTHREKTLSQMYILGNRQWDLHNELDIFTLGI